jgi:hypothetical protein
MGTNGEEEAMNVAMIKSRTECCEDAKTLERVDLQAQRVPTLGLVIFARA